MSDSTIKNTIYLLAAILTLYPVIELLFKKHKWYFKVAIILFISFFWYVTVKYKGIIDRDNRVAIEKANKAEKENKQNRIIIEELKNKSDSTNHYLSVLKDSLKSVNISEDKRKTLNNYIGKVNTFNQY